MKILLMLVVLTTSATAAELPQYEVSGFPITPVQMTVLGATARAREVPPCDSDNACAAYDSVTALP